MKLISILSLFLLVGCATEINFYVPAQRFQTPETSGGAGSFDAALGMTQSQEITTVKVSDSIISSGSNVTLSKDAVYDFKKHIATGINLGLFERLDILASGYTDGPSYYGLKLQLIGADGPKKKEGFKMAITGSYAYMREKDSTQNITVGGNDREYKANLTVKGYDASVLMGYRFSKGLIMYISGGYSEMESESVMESNQFATVNIDGDVKMTAGTFGMRLGGNESTSLFVNLEASYNKVEYQNSLEEEQTSLGAVLGVTY